MLEKLESRLCNSDNRSGISFKAEQQWNITATVATASSLAKEARDPIVGTSKVCTNEKK